MRSGASHHLCPLLHGLLSPSCLDEHFLDANCYQKYTGHGFPRMDSLLRLASGFIKLPDGNPVVRMEKVNTILPPKSDFALDLLTNTNM